MCGICGVVDLGGNPIDEGVARDMRAVLAHRGPDEDGSYFHADASGPSVFLGQRRLRIIDLSPAASQPLANEDGSVLVTFNGEIYNFRELRDELLGRGHVFRSKSDTEVIVHGYEEWGAQVVQRLDGMFAFGLWDGRRRSLLLARDRCGKKPLYYSFDGRRFSFASEIKGLLAAPWVSKDIDATRIPEYLAYGYVGTPRTFFKSIRQVPPASYMEIGSDGVGRPQTYWAWELTEATPQPSSEEARATVRALMEEAVAKRLISDVPLGAFLSGGIDSAIVVGLMSKLTTEPVKTFTIGFADDPSFDEREPAALTARHFGTDHTDYVVRPSPVELVEKLLWHHDQPYGDSSAIPTSIVSKLARRDVTVALVGDGGDEVFAGYDRFLAAVLADRIPDGVARMGAMVARVLPRNSGYFSLRRRVERFTEGAGLPVDERYRGWISMFNDDELARVLHPDLRAHSGDEIHSDFRSHLESSNSGPLLNRLLKLNFETYLPDDLLVKMDRMSMASSLETRSPFLDRSVMEYVGTLAPELKLKGRRLKHLLKDAFADLLPDEILNRPKHGFGVPVGAWFRGELAPMFRDLVIDPGSRSRAYLDGDRVDALFDEHSQGQAEHGYRLWTVLNLELWLRGLEDGSRADTPLEVDAEVR